MGDRLQADVVIVGAGIAGTLAGYRLAKAGARVLVLESGPRVDRDKAASAYRSAVVKTLDAPFPRSMAAPAPSESAPGGYYVQEGPDLFKSTYLRVVGGTTWHWLGTALRFLPDDLRMKTLYGVGVDWPIGYDVLEPWYVESEIEMGVAGDDSLGSPRSTPYPMAPIPHSYSDLRIADRISALGYPVTATAQARNSAAYDGRPACCGSKSCIPICPIAARYDASVHVKKAELAGVRIVEEAIATAVGIGPDGRVSRVLFKRPDGTDHEASGKVYIVAAHGIETPKLLLMSRADALPDGVANRSGQVGRNLMDHPIQLSWALAGEALGQPRGPLSTGGIDATRNSASRGVRAAFRVELGNSGWQWPIGGPEVAAADLVRKGLRGQQLAAELAWHCTRQLCVSSLMEQLPDSDNRVTPAFDERDALGLPRPRLHYRIDPYTRDGMTAARAIHDRIFDALGATLREHRLDHEGAGHIMGTYRMGADPNTSVVDPNLRAHDHDNLYLLGSGVFSTGGAVNPTLTIAALALRAAHSIATALGR
ncbi:GMC family oxidoreductase [Sorangium sp. So ce363]|uniref:GMC family oxidoreductase n=1 Tax=Sorangium sp. So ce363 TaxID=3133304 RepID=UPI003F5E067E